MNRNGWKIKSKKDWCIAFIFTALIIYGISQGFTFRLNKILMRITDSRLTELNQPSGYGNTAVTFFIMGNIAGIVLIIKKQSGKKILGAVMTGILTALVCIGGYLLHCKMIVSTPESINPGSVRVSGRSLENNGFSVNYNEEDEDMVRLVNLCTSLKKLPGEEQKKLREKFERDYDEEIMIWLSYPERYFHSYCLILRIWEDKIYILRDNGREVIFFEDNGLIEMIKNYEMELQ